MLKYIPIKEKDLENRLHTWWIISKNKILVIIMMDIVYQY
jgi:hypothetical protein